MIAMDRLSENYFCCLMYQYFCLSGQFIKICPNWCPDPECLMGCNPDALPVAELTLLMYSVWKLGSNCLIRNSSWWIYKIQEKSCDIGGHSVELRSYNDTFVPVCKWYNVIFGCPLQHVLCQSIAQAWPVGPAVQLAGIPPPQSAALCLYQACCWELGGTPCEPMIWDFLDTVHIIN